MITKNIPKDEIEQINSFLARFERTMETRGLSFSDIKEKSSRMREAIFQDIENAIQQGGEYNLQKILEKNTKPRKVRDEDEVVLRIPIPEFMTLFSITKPRRNFRKRRRMRESDKIPLYKPSQTPKTPDEQAMFKQSAHSETTRTNPTLDLDAVKAYIDNRGNWLKKFTLRLHWIIFTLTALFYMSVFAVYIYSGLYPDVLNCYTKYNIYGFQTGAYCKWNDLQYNVWDIYQAIDYVWIIYVSALSLLFLVYLGVYVNRYVMRSKIGIFLINNEFYGSLFALEELGNLAAKFSYLGYLKFGEDVSE